jgi:hypothetical protein
MMEVKIIKKIRGIEERLIKLIDIINAQYRFAKSLMDLKEV